MSSYTHGMTKTSTYRIWSGIIQRCTNPRVKAWPYYGGRGVTICERWRHSFTSFLSDVGERPSTQHSIDRYPNQNGNYEPGNVRWATDDEQGSNQRSNRWFTIDNRTQTMSQWCAERDIDISKVHQRLSQGVPPEDAFDPNYNGFLHRNGKRTSHPEVRYRGVLIATNGAIFAQIKHNGKSIHLGTFSTQVQAAAAYNKAVRLYRGPNAPINRLKISL